MLNNREIKMLDIFSSGEEVSIKKLKEKFDISERMVRYDIDKINFVLSIFNIKPIYRNKSGTFKLDSNNKINKIKIMVKEAEPIDIEKRKKLIKLLLITSAKKTNISNLMNKFDTSRITINNDLNIIKKEFKEKDILLPHRADGFCRAASAGACDAGNTQGVVGLCDGFRTARHFVHGFTAIE